MEQKLAEIPPDINGLYRSLLDRLDNNVVLLSKQILMWVSQAPRPLKVEELAIACSIDKIRSVSHANTFIDGFKENIELCGPILKIQGEIVHLVHQSAKEFLCNPDLTPSTVFVSLDEANIQMAIACLSCFDVDGFEEVEDLVDEFCYGMEDHPDIASFEKYPFLEFSGEFWVQFVIHSDPIHPKCLKFFNEPSRHRVATTFRLNLIFGDIYWYDELSSLASDVLVLATYLGHFSLVRMLFDQRSTPNADEWDIDYALIVTLEKGYETIARLLLEKGAEVNAQGGLYGNALQAAASVEGSETIVRLLLEMGAEVNALGGFYDNALQAAASVEGSETIVRLLLEMGAEVNAQGGKYGNALQAAVSVKGSEKIVRLLLEKGAEVNAQGGLYGNALQGASVKGSETIVRLLLEKGAEVNAQGGKYGNALQAASVKGSETIVRLLLEKGANVNTQGGYYGSALKAAKSLGLETVIRILSDASAQLVGGDFALDNSKASSVTSLIVCDDHAALDISDDTSTTSLPYNDPSRPNINTIATIQGKRLIVF